MNVTYRGVTLYLDPSATFDDVMWLITRLYAADIARMYAPVSVGR